MLLASYIAFVGVLAHEKIKNVSVLHLRTETYTFVELFAGEGNASRCAVWAGYKVASVDIIYWDRYTKGRKRKCRKNSELRKCNKNPLDINSTPGLSFPGFANSHLAIYCLCIDLDVQSVDSLVLPNSMG